MPTTRWCPLNHSYSVAVTATEQLCSQIFLMAYSQELLVFSPIDRWEIKHTHIQWGEKKSLLFLVERQWSSRSSQYKKNIYIWSLVKRIKLPYPSKAKREHHKSVNNPRGIWWALPSILDCQRGVCVCVFEMSLPSQLPLIFGPDPNGYPTCKCAEYHLEWGQQKEII